MLAFVASLVLATAVRASAENYEEVSLLRKLLSKQQEKATAEMAAHQRHASKQRYRGDRKLIAKSATNPLFTLNDTGTTLRVVTVNENPYVNCGDGSCQTTDSCAETCSGLAIDVLKEIAKPDVAVTNGFSIKISLAKNYTDARAQVAACVVNNPFSNTACPSMYWGGFFVLPSQFAVVDFTLPIVQTGIVLLSQRSRVLPTLDPADFPSFGLTLCVKTGGAIAVHFRDSIYGSLGTSKFLKTPCKGDADTQSECLVQQVANGECDLFAEDKIPAEALVKKDCWLHIPSLALTQVAVSGGVSRKVSHRHKCPNRVLSCDMFLNILN
jgi:hypothetical protein